MEFFDETLASAAVEKPALNGVVAEEEQVPITHPAKSHAAVAAENPTPISSVANGEGEGVPGAHTAAKSYAAVAVLAEIAALRAAKLDLEAKLDEARRENKFLAEETHRIEGIFPQVRAEATIAAATSAEEIALLRMKIDRLKTEMGEHELDMQSHDKLAKEVDALRQEKLKLEEEIRALKASTTAAATKEREAAPAAEAPNEGEVAWLGMVVAAAAGVASMAAVMLICLRKR